MDFNIEEEGKRRFVGETSGLIEALIKNAQVTDEDLDFYALGSYPKARA